MKWITRCNVKVDRVACPWLIRRFIDPDAEFLFTPEHQLLEVSRETRATPFDAPRIAEIKLNHRGHHCTFEAIVTDFCLDDAALRTLALIVRAADVRGQESAAPEGMGLRAISQGFAALHSRDEDRLTGLFPVYDALYAYVKAMSLMEAAP